MLLAGSCGAVAATVTGSLVFALWGRVVHSSHSSVASPHPVLGLLRVITQAEIQCSAFSASYERHEESDGAG